MDKAVFPSMQGKGIGYPWGKNGGRKGLVESRPRHRDKVAEGEELLKGLPRPDLQEGIHAENEEQFQIGTIPLSEIFDGPDGVRFARPL